METNAASKYIFTVVGLAMLIGTFFLVRDTKNFLKNALTADGTVIELVRSKSSDSDSYTYKPLVEFITQDGLTVGFISSTGSNPPAYSRGEIVQVLYEESFPEKARINGVFSLWGLEILLAVSGLLSFITGVSRILPVTSRW